MVTMRFSLAFIGSLVSFAISLEFKSTSWMAEHSSAEPRVKSKYRERSSGLRFPLPAAIFRGIAGVARNY